jgi:hypothetical protein
MKISEIEALLRRYDAGETTPEEEERLARYFTAGPTPPQWAGYAAQFGYFRAQGQETYPPRPSSTGFRSKRRPKRLYRPRVIRLSWGWAWRQAFRCCWSGFLAAWLLLRGGAPAAPTGDMVALQQEVKEMKQLVMLSLLENQSASERIRAVSYAEALPGLDPAVREALIRTLDGDQNLNVRLAAAEALGRFPDSEEVRQALVGALERQPDPMLQITLIHLLVNMEEKEPPVPSKSSSATTARPKSCAAWPAKASVPSRKVKHTHLFTIHTMKTKVVMLGLLMVAGQGLAQEVARNTSQTNDRESVQSSAGEFRIALSKPAQPGKLVIHDLEPDVVIERHAGKDVLVTQDGHRSAPEKARGLRSLSSAGTDNTGIGLEIRESTTPLSRSLRPPSRTVRTGCWCPTT